MHPSYVAGFIDGDGSIYINQQKQGFCLQVQVTQSVLNILQEFLEQFGGNLYKSTVSKNENQRLHHGWRVCGKKSKPIIDILLTNGVMKYEQAQIANEFMNLINKPNKTQEKLLLCTRLKNQYQHRTNSQYNRINIQYIAGLFDAEGCIHIRFDEKYNKFRWFVKLTQKSDTLILTKILEYMNIIARYDNFAFVIERKDDCVNFVKALRDYLIVKQAQSFYFLEFFETNDTQKQMELIKLLNIEKHADDLHCN